MEKRVQYENITTDSQLREFCKKLSDSKLIGFDTEFVSEDSYRPHLCLIQVACAHGLAVIDTIALPEVGAFWEAITQPGHRTIVHAGREEFRFCWQATGKRPNDLFDTQIAAGMIGMEYPAAYGSLMSKLVGKTIPKGETRTNWRNRPLSERQIDYALKDVVYLEDLYQTLTSKIEALGRATWVQDEFQAWQDLVEEAESSERWHRLGGLSNMSRRSLAVARSLWQWRERTAQSRNSPPRRVLRDDLLVELAKRKTADPKRIRALRGMDHRGVQKSLPEIAACIQEALAISDDDCPASIRSGKSNQQANLLSQFLTVALSSICRDAKIAPSIVGTVQDMRDLVAYHLKPDSAAPPKLASGWRAEIVGNVIEQLMHGQLAMHVTSPQAEQPLGISPR
ncbi:MAG TPA: ribonuclease D [Planctomycetaceae bacterium]|nr:ribonuclease D [Blastopirellula sp.]HAY78306.1 ribonuclease D [Planctomycetaceae bacterium]